MNHLISIVVPVYNKEPYLANCLKSLQAQTYPEVEILLVDDGSIDRSVDICEQFCAEDERFHLFQQENSGQNAARLKGVEAAHGDWTIFVDADDLVAPEMCALLMANMEKTGADIVHGAMQYIKKGKLAEINDRLPGVYSGKEVLERFFQEKDHLLPQKHGESTATSSLCASLFHTSVICEVLRTMDMRMRYYEDTACLFSLFLKSNIVSYISDVVYYYQEIMTSTSHAPSFDLWEQTRYFGTLMTKRFREADMPMDAYRAIDGLMLDGLILREGCRHFLDYPGIFPFVSEKPVGRIAFYGAGSFGERFYQNHKTLPTIGRFDRNYKKYQDQGVDVRDPKTLHVEADDAILVTILSDRIASQAAAELREQLHGFPHIYTISEEILNSPYTLEKLKALRN